jgi:predicted Zn-dependent protease
MHVTNGILAAWRLELGEAADARDAPPKDPWSRLRLAQRSVALGQPEEAKGLIFPLRRKAGPAEAWSGHYWTILMQIRQLEGDREQALKDYAEYRRLFKGHADAGALDKLLEAV